MAEMSQQQQREEQMQTTGMAALTQALSGGRGLRGGEQEQQGIMKMLDREVRRVVNNELDRDLTGDLKGIRDQAKAKGETLTPQQELERLTVKKTEDIIKHFADNGIKVGRDNVKLTPESLVPLIDIMSGHIAARLDRHRENKMDKLPGTVIGHLRDVGQQSLNDKLGVTFVGPPAPTPAPSQVTELTPEQKRVGEIIAEHVTAKVGLLNVDANKVTEGVVRELTKDGKISTDPKEIEAAFTKVLAANGVGGHAELAKELTTQLDGNIFGGKYINSSITGQIDDAISKLGQNPTQEQQLDALFKAYNDIKTNNNIAHGSDLDKELQARFIQHLQSPLQDLACAGFESYNSHLARSGEGIAQSDGYVETPAQLQQRQAAAFEAMKKDLLPPKAQDLNPTIDKTIEQVLLRVNMEIASETLTPEMMNKAIVRTFDQVYKDNAANVGDPVYREALDKAITERLKVALGSSAPDPKAVMEQFTKLHMGIVSVMGQPAEKWQGLSAELLGKEATPDQVKALAEKLQQETKDLNAEQIREYALNLLSKSKSELIEGVTPQQERSLENEKENYKKYFKAMIYGNFEGERKGEEKPVYSTLTTEEKEELKEAYRIFKAISKNDPSVPVSLEVLDEHRQKLDAILQNRYNQSPVEIPVPNANGEITLTIGTVPTTVKLNEAQKVALQKAKEDGLTMYYDNQKEELVFWTKSATASYPSIGAKDFPEVLRILGGYYKQGAAA